MFKWLDSLFKWLPRLFLLSILLGVLIIVCLGAFSYFNLKVTLPPDIKAAPYALQAYYEKDGLKFPTRYYYAEKIELSGSVAVLTNYWTFDGEKYHKHKGDKEIQPPFTIVRRLR